MILFLFTLVEMLVMSDIPAKAGGNPEQIPPDFVDPNQPAKAYSTAFYWEMYGELFGHHPER